MLRGKYQRMYGKGFKPNEPMQKLEMQEKKEVQQKEVQEKKDNRAEQKKLFAAFNTKF